MAEVASADCTEREAASVTTNSESAWTKVVKQEKQTVTLLREALYT
jgi:hypothetical protein